MTVHHIFANPACHSKCIFIFFFLVSSIHPKHRFSYSWNAKWILSRILYKIYHIIYGRIDYNRFPPLGGQVVKNIFPQYCRCSEYLITLPCTFTIIETHKNEQDYLQAQHSIMKTEFKKHFSIIQKHGGNHPFLPKCFCHLKKKKKEIRTKGEKKQNKKGNK